MFLCPRCHNSSDCEEGWIEEMMRSYGACESCGTRTGCLDCHGYGRKTRDS